MIHYKEGYKYQLSRDYKHQTLVTGHDIDIECMRLEPSGLLTIKHGYAWDGASGPTYDDKTNMRASLVHDALYQLIRLELIEDSWRSHADDLLHDIMIEDGAFGFRADYYRWAVSTFAKPSSRPSAERPELVAP